MELAQLDALAVLGDEVKIRYGLARFRDVVVGLRLEVRAGFSQHRDLVQARVAIVAVARLVD